MIGIKLSERKLHLLGFAFLSCLVAFSADISAALTDHFHEGEFLGFLWQIRDYYDGLARFPLLVHGGMDYIPAFIANVLFGYNKTIVGTRILLMVLSAIQYFFFLDIAYSLTRRDADRLVWTLILAAYFLYATPQLNSSVVISSYFPIRDLFLTLTIWGMVRYAANADVILSHICLAIGSSSTIIAFFWCYNRGLMAMSFSCIILVGLIVRKRIGGIIVMVLSALSFLILAEHTKALGSILENVHNISYWINNSSELNYVRLNFQYLPGIIGLIVFCLFVSATCFFFFYATRHIEFENDLLIFVLAGLFMIQAISVKVVFGVPTLEYELHGGWPSIMLLFFCCSRLCVTKLTLPKLKIFIASRQKDRQGRFFPHTLSLVLLSLLIFLITCQQNMAFPYARFAKNIMATVDNDKILPRDLIDVRDIIANTNNACYYNWVNDGVVAFLARKTFCTDYTYVYYAGAKQEQAMLLQLNKAAPSVIITAADLWPVTRHKELMSERFSAIDEYINNNYGNIVAIGRYQLAFKHR